MVPIFYCLTTPLKSLHDTFLDLYIRFTEHLIVELGMCKSFVLGFGQLLVFCLAFRICTCAMLFIADILPSKQLIEIICPRKMKLYVNILIVKPVLLPEEWEKNAHKSEFGKHAC